MKTYRVSLLATTNTSKYGIAAIRKIEAANEELAAVIAADLVTDKYPRLKYILINSVQAV